MLVKYVDLWEAYGKQLQLFKCPASIKPYPAYNVKNRTNFQKSDLPSLPSSSSLRPPRPLVSARWFTIMAHSQATRVTFPEGRNPIPAWLEGLGQKVSCD